MPTPPTPPAPIRRARDLAAHAEFGYRFDHSGLMWRVARAVLRGVRAEHPPPTEQLEEEKPVDARALIGKARHLLGGSEADPAPPP